MLGNVTARLGPGSTFAAYRIESVVGRGGMGVVYQATDLSLGRPVALKLIAPELADDPRFRQRFLDEPRLAASLDHASVIPIYEAGEHDGQLYLAMRYVPGSDLRTLLTREGALEPERALAILGQIAGALDAAHRQGLVHRDVKPANVLLDEDEHAYLTDFGITKQLGDDTSDAGQGTLDYLAPEQIRGEPVDGRTDGYALACVLYECLAGHPPFRRQTPAETMWAHLREEPPTLESHPALDPVLQRGLAQERDDRYPTCAALIDAARDVLAPRTSRVRMLVVAGLALIAVAIAGALLASRPASEGAAARAPEGNGVAAIEPGSEESAELVETARRAEQHRRRRRAPSGSSTATPAQSRASTRRRRRSPGRIPSPGVRDRPRCRRRSAVARERRRRRRQLDGHRATAIDPTTDAITTHGEPARRNDRRGPLRPQRRHSRRWRSAPARCGRPAAAGLRVWTRAPARSSRLSKAVGQPARRRAARACGTSALQTPAR